MDSNPFSTGAKDPFEDPSVVEASSTNYAPDDYFALQNPYVEDAESPPVTIHAPEPRGAPHQNSRNGLSEQEMTQREEQLFKREAALIERERNPDDHVVKNWPAKCCAITYHDIPADIPQRFQIMIRKFYSILLWTWLCLVFNWVVIMTVIFGGRIGSSAKISVSEGALWSSLYVVLGVPGAWSFWYRPIYYSCKTSAGNKWICFFFMFGLHTLFTIVMAIGPAHVSGCGLFLFLKLVSDKNRIASLMAIVATGMWILNAFVSVILIKQAHSMWKSDGHLHRLKKDVATGVVNAAVENQMDSGRV